MDYVWLFANTAKNFPRWLGGQSPKNRWGRAVGLLEAFREVECIVEAERFGDLCQPNFLSSKKINRHS